MGDFKRNATEMRLHAATLKGNETQNGETIVERQARVSVSLSASLFLEITRYFFYAIF